MATMFKKEQLDPFFDELMKEHKGTPEWEKIVRDAHLGIALHDAGSPLNGIDPVVVGLIDKHKPQD